VLLGCGRVHRGNRAPRPVTSWKPDRPRTTRPKSHVYEMIAACTVAERRRRAASWFCLPESERQGGGLPMRSKARHWSRVGPLILSKVVPSSVMADRVSSFVNNGNA
jgi:hypothetical protein